MIKYKLNITDCYPQVICLDNNIGLKSYFSILDIIKKKENSSILLNNMVINIDDELWYGVITKTNSNSIVARALNSLDVDGLDIFTLMMQRAELTISGIKCVYIKLSTDTDNYYHSIGNEFCVGDKHIWLAGYCSDFENTAINIMLVFDGEIHLNFHESDIVIESINFNSYINFYNVNDFNKANDSFISLKKTRIENLGFNNVKSELLRFDNNIKYFDYSETGNVAIKNYNV